MKPQDFQWRTRQQRQEFDAIKIKSFEPTPEEILQQEKEQENLKQEQINFKLSTRWIVKPDVITKEWMLKVMDWLDAKQFLWEDLDWYLNNQLELHWTLEKVMDNLVLTYL